MLTKKGASRGLLTFGREGMLPKKWQKESFEGDAMRVSTLCCGASSCTPREKAYQAMNPEKLNVRKR